MHVTKRKVSLHSMWETVPGSDFVTSLKVDGKFGQMVLSEKLEEPSMKFTIS